MKTWQKIILGIISFLIIILIYLNLNTNCTYSNKCMVGVEFVDLQKPADTDNMITFDKFFTLENNKQLTIKISTYNPYNETIIKAKPLIFNCTNDEFNFINNILIKSMGVDILPRTEQKSPISISYYNITKGDYICDFEVRGTNNLSVKTKIPVRILD